MAPSETATHEVDQPLGMRWTVGRVAAVVAALAMVAFWAWIFSGAPKRSNPDYLDDRAYVKAAETRCQRLRDDLDDRGLLVPGTFDDAVERAAQLDVANRLVADLVDDLAAAAPTTGDDGVRLRGWLADWRTYVADREAYADALRTNPEARLFVTENRELGDSVDQTIAVFADVNDMPACETPGDVG